MNKSIKNILVTGGAGYIGSHVCHLLIDKGYNVTCIDNLVTGNKELLPDKVKLEIIDIADKKKVSNLVKNNQFDLAMHFAGLIRVEESVKEPQKYIEYNFTKAKIFLETCYENNLKKIIFSSSASIYGNPPNEKVDEEYSLNPLNPYAQSKLDLEKYIINSSKQFNSKYVILRYFNVAGADTKMRSGLISKYSSHLIKIASEVAIGKKDTLIINGNDYDTKDGTAVRDYIHVTDLAEIHLITANYLMKNGKSDIFNCGYGKGFSVNEVIDCFNNILEKKIDFKIGPRRFGDSSFIVANCEKFKKTFKWKPKYDDLKVILKSAFEWEKKINSIKNKI